METTILGSGHVAPAVEALKAGQLVAFPTETVYGLGADGTNAAACHRIFEAKGRPQDNPLILHVLDKPGLMALTLGALPTSAEALVEAFWPGPLTVVVPANPDIPEVVRAGLNTVAVRSPNHPVARDLIEGLGRPIAAPSANLSGRPSPTEAAAVWEDMAGRIPLIIDGGSTQVGLESTVVDCTTTPPTLLRPGGIGLDLVASVVGEVALASGHGPVRAPGMKYRHYAPKSPVIWLDRTNSEAVQAALSTLSRDYPNMAVIAPEPLPEGLVGQYQSLGRDAVTAAHRLFQSIRYLDQLKPDAIVIVWESEEGLGLAVKNRIEKAATTRVRL